VKDEDGGRSPFTGGMKNRERRKSYLKREKEDRGYRDPSDLHTFQREKKLRRGNLFPKGNDGAIAEGDTKKKKSRRDTEN